DDGRAGGVAERGAGAGRIEIVSDILTHASGDGAAVAEREHDGVVGEARLDVQGTADGDAVDGDLADEGDLRAAIELGGFLAGDLDQRALGIDAEFLAETGADEDGVVPSDLGDRVGALLEPAVVGEAAVIDLVVEGEADLEIIAEEGLELEGYSEEGAEGGGGVPDVDHGIDRNGELDHVQEAAEDVIGVAAGDAGDGVENQRVRV